MIWFLASWIGRIVALVLVLALVVVGWGLWFYFSDQAIEADVKEKTCDPTGQSVVKVETRWWGIDYEAKLDYEQCLIVPDDGYVRFHVRSQRTIIFAEEGGACIWDTKVGRCD